MNPNWLWWSAGPGGAPFVWFLAWQRTDTPQYGLFAGCYLVLYLALFSMFFFIGTTPLPLGTTLSGDLLLQIGFVVFLAIWVGGYWHVRHEQEEIRLRLKYAAAARTHRKDVNYNLEDRIRIEYGFEPRETAQSTVQPTMRPTASSKRQPDQLDRQIAEALEEHRRNRQHAATDAQRILSKEQNRIRQEQQTDSRTVFPPSSRFPQLRPDNTKIDINVADKETLAAVSIIEVTVASEIVREREQAGPFRSFDDFCLRCRIKPHVRVQLENLVVIESGNEQSTPRQETRQGKQAKRDAKHRRID